MIQKKIVRAKIKYYLFKEPSLANEGPEFCFASLKNSTSADFIQFWKRNLKLCNYLKLK